MNRVSRRPGLRGRRCETYRLQVAPAGGGDASASGLRSAFPGARAGREHAVGDEVHTRAVFARARDQVQHIRAACRFIGRQIGQPAAQRLARLAREFELVQVGRGFFADRFLAGFIAQPSRCR